MAEWDNAACMEMDRYLDRLGIRHSPPSLGSTIGNPPCSGHTTGSNHYPQFYRGRFCGGPPGSTGQARDYGTNGSDCQRIADELERFAKGSGYVIKELIWTRRLPRTGTYYKRGKAYTPSLALAWQHRHHVHAAIEVGRHLPFVGPPPAPIPVPRPTPAPPPKRSDPMYVIKGSTADPAVFATNFVTKQWIENPQLLETFLFVSENHRVDPIDQGACDSIPLEGIAPPGYQGQYAMQYFQPNTDFHPNLGDLLNEIRAT